MLSAHQPGSTWRVTTAARVFVLALALGRVLSAGEMRGLLVTFVAVALVAIGDLRPRAAGARTGSSCGSRSSRGSSSAPCCRPARPTPRTCWSTSRSPRRWRVCATAGCRCSTPPWPCVAHAAAGVDQHRASADESTLAGGLFWLAVGLGTGLLAAWQTRTLRELVDAGAPVAEAHRLLVQLQALAHDGEVGLDSSGASELLVSSILRRVDATRAAVFTRDRDGALALLWSHGQIEGLAEAAALVGDDVVATPETLAVPVVSADRVIAVVVLGDLLSWQRRTRTRSRRRSRQRHALRLDTALIFDDVRGLATSEERHRIAREMHDGVAQELVALGYAVDEIASVTAEHTTRELSTALRAEITRVVSELRFSIFDLRHDIAGHSLVDRPRRLRQCGRAPVRASRAPHARRGRGAAVVTHPDRDPAHRPGGDRQRPSTLAGREPVGDVDHRHASPSACGRGRRRRQRRARASSTTASRPCASAPATSAPRSSVTDRAGRRNRRRAEQPITRAPPTQGVTRCPPPSCWSMTTS